MRHYSSSTSGIVGIVYQNFAARGLLAGSAPDRQAARELLARIGDWWDPGVWQERKYFDGYRKWAVE